MILVRYSQNYSNPNSSRKSADSEDDSSGVSSLGAAGSVGRRSLHATCERVDSLLQLIERLRTSLAPLRSEEYAEVAAFEAAMLSWEAALKVRKKTREGNKHFFS
jgi:hypothetical protein